MNILLVSQCSKNALTETRRILDHFAERFGTRTWQTQITQQGLNTLKGLLKRTARKNTAVACHWIRGKNKTELLWIVGNANAFNEKGVVPTNTTEQDILRKHYEHDWHTLKDIQILSVIAALFHDFGKANKFFQKKLSHIKKNIRDPHRHEWISLRLFQAFVGADQDDKSWLVRLANLENDDINLTQKACLKALRRDGIDPQLKSPFDELPPLAKAVGWLIVTHHALLQPQETVHSECLKDLLNAIEPSWNRAKPDADAKDNEACWRFDQQLPFASQHWRQRASYWAKEALKQPDLMRVDWLKDLYSLHLARLSLILADHYYSNLTSKPNLGDSDFPLYANTDKEGKLNQRLDEHLIGVGKNASHIVKTLPLLNRVLPRIARHKGFKRRSADPRFRWQDQAYDLANSLRERSADQGFFGVNMASTGCGKTLANGRIMYALADPARGARFSIALGLRTLTLQTGQAYRERLGLEDDDLAILVGSIAVKKLFELGEKESAAELNNSWQTGSESAESLLDDNSYVHFEGSPLQGPFTEWLGRKPKEEKLLAAPIVVCTIDHLIRATEGTRGGKQIIPMLRLLTSDLVLDEPDDFSIEDLPALTRLVHWAGMLGSRVLLSSATLAPALVAGLFTAYCAGREMFHKSRRISRQTVNVCCAWFDEHKAITSDHCNAEGFSKTHEQFVDKRIKKLQQAEVKRRAVIKPLDIHSQVPAEVRQQVANAIGDMIYELHDHHHSVDNKTGKRVSFGLVRFANIDPLIDIARYLFKRDAHPGHQIKFCCYHSRHPLLVRSYLENQLDNFLDRRKPLNLFNDNRIRHMLDNNDENNFIYVVFASPVAEVGRDHDYDWGIVEPSSMRSIIQLAGRIKRHREGACKTPNLYLLNNNIKSLECRDGKQPAYCKPGFETSEKDFLLHTHSLIELLHPHQYEIISAEPRVRASDNPQPNYNLCDLEHERLKALMREGSVDSGWVVSQWWQTQAALAGILQQKQPFRFNPCKKESQEYRFALIFDEDEPKPAFFNIEGGEQKLNDCLFEPIQAEWGQRVSYWGMSENYVDAVYDLAKRFDMENIRECCEKFGWLDLPGNGQEWCYNHFLGLRRKD